MQQKAICVTCNYAARARGIYKLQRITDAKRLCPELVLVSGEDLTKFRAVSRAVNELIRTNFTPQTQKLGMDEFFIDVTGLCDELEANAPFDARRAAESDPAAHDHAENGSWTMHAWAGFVCASSGLAPTIVERRVPLAELAFGWTSGTEALACITAAASGAALLGHAGRRLRPRTAVEDAAAAASTEPAWSRHKDLACVGVASRSSCASAGTTSGMTCLPDPSPSAAVPCPDAQAQWAATPVCLLPASATVSRVEHRLRLASAIAARIRHTIACRLGISCCAGIGTSKLLAKFAVNIRKPCSQTVMLPEAVPEFVRTLRVRALPGIGYRTNRMLQEVLGITTVPQLLQATEGQLLGVLGTEAAVARVQSMARGIDTAPVTPSGPPLTISDEDSFRRLSDSETVKAELGRLCTDLLPRLDADAAEFGRRPATLRVGVRRLVGKRLTKQQPFPEAALSSHVCPAPVRASRIRDWRHNAAQSPPVAHASASASASSAGLSAPSESSSPTEDELDSLTVEDRAVHLAKWCLNSLRAAVPEMASKAAFHLTLISVGASNFTAPTRGIDFADGSLAVPGDASGSARTIDAFLSASPTHPAGTKNLATRRGRSPPGGVKTSPDAAATSSSSLLVDPSVWSSLPADVQAEMLGSRQPAPSRSKRTRRCGAASPAKVAKPAIPAHCQLKTARSRPPKQAGLLSFYKPGDRV